MFLLVGGLGIFALVLGTLAFILIVATLFGKIEEFAKQEEERGGREIVCQKHGNPRFLIRHARRVTCQRAEETLLLAEEAWIKLGAYFPERDESSSIVINLVKDERLKSLLRLDALSIQLNLTDPKTFASSVEEIHHFLYLIQARQKGEEVRYVSEPPIFADHGDVVFHYARHPHEYEALKAVVEITGKRAELLEEVERYRRNNNIS